LQQIPDNATVLINDRQHQSGECLTCFIKIH